MKYVHKGINKQINQSKSKQSHTLGKFVYTYFIVDGDIQIGNTYAVQHNPPSITKQKHIWDIIMC